MSRLAEAISRFRPKPRDFHGIVSVDSSHYATVRDTRLLWLRGPGDHEYNMKLSREAGVRPLAFADIVASLGKTWENWVLFDTPPTHPGITETNHWRVAEVDWEGEMLRLQFCDTFGSRDVEDIGPFSLSIHEPFFTGVSVQRRLGVNGEEISLSAFREELRQAGLGQTEVTDEESLEISKRIEEVFQGSRWSEEIYWSEGAGPHFGLLDFRYIRPQRGVEPLSEHC